MNKATAYQKELKSITKNAGLTALGLIVFNLLSFLNNAIITRTLGADQYGLYVLATRILEFLLVTSALGLNQSIIRFISMYAGTGNKEMIKGTLLYAFKATLIASLTIFLATWLLSEEISTRLFERPELTKYLKTLIIALPSTVLLNALLNTFIGLKQVKYQVLLANIFSPLVFLTMITTVFYLGYRLDALVWVHVINLIIVCVVAGFIFRNIYLKDFSKVKARTETKKLWNYNLPVYVAHFANMAFRVSPIFIMGYFISNEQIGVFNVSYKVGALVLFSMSAFQMIFLPTISELFARNDRKTISGLFKTVTKWIFSFSLIIFMIITAFNEPVLRVFGEEFSSGATVLMLIMVGELFNASTGLVGATILMSGRSRVVLINSVFQLSVVAGLSWWLIPLYGNRGAAVAYATSLIVMNVVRVVELYKFEKIHPYKLSTLKTVVAGICGFVPVYYLSSILNYNDYIEMVAGSVLLIGIFIGMTILLKLDEDDRYILGLIFSQLKKKK